MDELELDRIEHVPYEILRTPREERFLAPIPKNHKDTDLGCGTGNSLYVPRIGLC